MVEQTLESSWRPVQFLGNKLRVLDEVANAVTSGLSLGSTVWDAFAGSSVVSQSLASRGMRVMATDTLACSVVFARALLGVRRSENPSLDGLRQLACVVPDERYRPWLKSVADEDAALLGGDAVALSALGRRLPLRWRKDGASAEAMTVFQSADKAASLRKRHPFASMLSTYAGTYLGVRQALEMDTIATAIFRGLEDGALDPWQRDVGLTALASAASAAVFSAGKHFAQPINIAGTLTAFQERRLLQDRSVSISESYLRAIDEIECSAAYGGGHMAREAVAENVSSDTLTRQGVDVVYADPPYTAQQYSRFYHLLDTLVLGTPAPLQYIGGAVTKGLYPEDRFKSAFCSKRLAPSAFEALARSTRGANARLVLSYSVSRPASTGNQRSISLDGLLAILEETFGSRSVEVRELDIRYRQFNQRSSANLEREDPELLIIAEAS